MAIKTKPIADLVRRDIPVHLVAPEDKAVQVNITIPASVRKAWKEEALKRDTTIVALILGAMARELGN